MRERQSRNIASLAMFVAFHKLVYYFPIGGLEDVGAFSLLQPVTYFRGRLTRSRAKAACWRSQRNTRGESDKISAKYADETVIPRPDSNAVIELLMVVIEFGNFSTSLAGLLPQEIPTVVYQTRLVPRISLLAVWKQEREM